MLYDDPVEVSPNRPWGDPGAFDQQPSRARRPVWQKVLLWFPNRFLDLIDVFKVDVGVGPAYGGVVRVTKWGQVGHRTMAPVSLRLGNFGRELPGLVETTNESGIGAGFVKSKDRKICSGELGIGLDALIAGAYVGLCADQLADFIGGIFFLDFKEDDLE